jgi:hypothetical protein
MLSHTITLNNNIQAFLIPSKLGWMKPLDLEPKKQRQTHMRKRRGKRKGNKKPNRKREKINKKLRQKGDKG